MPVVCPCCKASNDTGPFCRRCKADLTSLFAIEDRRGHTITAAQSAAVAGDFDLALVKLDEAEAHRAGPEVLRFRATVHLLNRDYAAAWKWYRAGTEPTPGRAR